MVRITDYELRCPNAKSAASARQIDKCSMQKNKKILALRYDIFVDGPKFMLIETALLLDNKSQICGVYDSGFELTQQNFKQFIDISYTELKQERNAFIINDRYDEFNLTNRESDILYHLIRGNTQNAIGLKLHISPRTVETHLENVKKKLSVTTKSQIIEKAILSQFNSLKWLH